MNLTDQQKLLRQIRFGSPSLSCFGVFGILPLWWVRRKIQVLEGVTVNDIFAMYPHLTLPLVQAAFAYAADKIADEIILEAAA